MAELRRVRPSRAQARLPWQIERLPLRLRRPRRAAPRRPLGAAWTL